MYLLIHVGVRPCAAASYRLETQETRPLILLRMFCFEALQHSWCIVCLLAEDPGGLRGKCPRYGIVLLVLRVLLVLPHLLLLFRFVLLQLFHLLFRLLVLLLFVLPFLLLPLCILICKIILILSASIKACKITKLNAVSSTSIYIQWDPLYDPELTNGIVIRWAVLAIDLGTRILSFVDAKAPVNVFNQTLTGLKQYKSYQVIVLPETTRGFNIMPQMLSNSDSIKTLEDGKQQGFHDHVMPTSFKAYSMLGH